jgi:zinc protease
MKRILLVLALLAGITMARPLLQLPVPERMVLSNGLTVYCLQDAGLPLVAFRMIIRDAGLAADPAEQEGLADLAATLMMKGAAGQSALQVAEALDYLGASLDINASEEYLSVSGQSLTRYWPDLLKLTGDCLLHPALAEDEFGKEVDRRIDEITSIKDEPASAVRYYFRKAYFQSHPFGHLSLGSEATLQKLKVTDVRQWHGKALQPNKAVLAVVGDVKPAELRRQLEKQFQSWKNSAGKAKAGKIAPFPKPAGKRCLLINKTDATQAYFILGGPGAARGDARGAQNDVMNTLFGGRFTSWLNNELRVKRGLTYGARSGMESWQTEGLYTVSSYTRNEKIGEMLQVGFELLQKARSSGFSEEEVTSSRNYILGQFPPRFESLGSKARTYTDLAFYGLPFDYYNTYLANVQASTVEQVHNQARALLPMDRYVLVVIGKADEILEQLKPYGEWTVKSVTEAGF